METKQCTCCKEVKPLSEFSKEKARKDGHQSQCKECTKEYQKEYNKANADKMKEYRQANADLRMLYRIKNRSKVKGLEFNLEVEDILGVTHCPVFGWELKRNLEGQQGNRPNSPSVDRIIPELGYVKGNIQILSQKANTMKLDATPEELLMFADWIIKTYRK